MRLSRMILAFASLILVAACTSSSDPVPGESCSASDKPVCESVSGAGARSWTLYECTDGKWRDIPCKSGGMGTDWGCVTTELDIECKHNQVEAGDPCWSRHEGQEQCGYGIANSDQKLTCRNGVWVGEPCVSCFKPSGYPIKCD